MRRRAPRTLHAALDELTRDAGPPGLLAAVQAHWPQVAGAAVAREASPESERAGEVVVACRSATWAQELTLLAPDLLERLNAALEGGTEGPVRGLRFRPGRGPGPPRRAVS